MPARNRIASFALLLTILGILIAGLWPFNFKPRNRVKALPQGGLSIKGYGQILSTVPWHMSRPKSRFSVEFWFQPAGIGYAYDSPVLSLSDAGIVNFAIGQSGRDLYAAVLSQHEDGVTVLRKLWMDGACGRSRPLFVTVVSSEDGVTVYLDGHLGRSFSLPISAKTLSGTILLGHTPTGDQPWSGDLFGMALYDKELNAVEVMHHLEQWLARQTQGLAKQEGVLCLYDLRSASANSVFLSLGPYGPDLVLPESFRVRNKEILGWPTTLSRSIVLDVLENIAGFIPVGLLFIIASRGITRKSMHRVLIFAVSAAALLSLSIELLQVYLPSRDSSMSDLFANILGASLGAGLGVILFSARRATFHQGPYSR
jgi:hypothetical protein